jgi:hypothetical protein
MHVVWDLTFHFLLFKLNGLVWDTTDALSENFSKSCGLNDVNKNLVALFNEA